MGQTMRPIAAARYPEPAGQVQGATHPHDCRRQLGGQPEIVAATKLPLFTSAHPTAQPNPPTRADVQHAGAFSQVLPQQLQAGGVHVWR